MIRPRIIDLLSRKRSWSYYRRYVESQWYDRAQLDQYRVAKLRRLLSHCERAVPFYGDILRAHSIRPDRIDSLDVLKLFPIVDKPTVKREYDRILSRSLTGLGTIHFSQTGGTTGEPLRVPKDAGMRSSAEAARLRFYDWMGINFGDPVIVFWGAPIIAAGWKRRFRNALLGSLANTKQVDTFGISSTDMPRIMDLFRRVQPVLVHGYCQSIYEIARWVVESGERIQLKAVSTTVEPLFEEYRPVFRAAFSCEAFDEYGCGEVETIAMECPSHSGRHVIEERVVVELDDKDGIIVTDLDNLAFPFIRYRNGDRAIASDHSCGCGRGHKLLERIVGRVGDVIVGPSGRRVHPEFFTHLLNETGIAQRRGLRKYQVMQESPKCLRWRIVAAPMDDSERRWLTDTTRAYLGDIDVQIEQVSDIPVARSGKFQYVISQH